MHAPTPPDWTREELEGRLRRPPFNAWLGLQLVDWNADGVTLGLDARPEIFGHPTVQALHGGVLATLVDVACSFAVIVRTGESLFTVDMRVDYHRPATASAYRVVSQVVRVGKTLATSDARVMTMEGVLVASGRAVFQHFPHARS